jgi:hypothetical protein
MDIITTDFLKKLYSRASEFSAIKFGAEPHQIVIYSDGTLSAVYFGRERGDADYETINAEDLSADLDAVAKERAKKLEQERIERDAYIKEQERLRAIREKEERREQYLRLKKEFE